MRPRAAPAGKAARRRGRGRGVCGGGGEPKRVATVAMGEVVARRCVYGQDACVTAPVGVDEYADVTEASEF
jgi:hypothetical protein